MRACSRVSSRLQYGHALSTDLFFHLDSSWFVGKLQCRTRQFSSSSGPVFKLFHTRDQAFASVSSVAARDCHFLSPRVFSLSIIQYISRVIKCQKFIHLASEISLSYHITSNWTKLIDVYERVFLCSAFGHKEITQDGHNFRRK